MHESFISSNADEGEPSDEGHRMAPDLQEGDPTLAEDQAEMPAYENTLTASTIWTPAFMLTFFLLLTLGLSAESLLTQLWANNGEFGPWIIEAHVLLAAGGWVALTVVTRSRWARLACLFGYVLSLFLTLNVILSAHGLDFTTPIQAYINVASCVALLGAFIGLSIENPPSTVWDHWLFLLVPLLSATGIVLTYFLTPQASVITSENALATAAMIACCLFWWLRPSCWRNRPGPTLLFGLAPIILLALALINGSAHGFFVLQTANPGLPSISNVDNFFFIQVVLFSLFLGCLLLVRREQHQQKAVLDERS